MVKQFSNTVAVTTLHLEFITSRLVLKKLSFLRWKIIIEDEINDG